jgi:hypothetical protein
LAERSELGNSNDGVKRLIFTLNSNEMVKSMNQHSPSVASVRLGIEVFS